MTPKEKALVLCQQFGRTTLFADDCNDGITLPLRVAKLCAMIAADECIKCCDNDYVDPYANQSSSKEYWKQVKEEIELL